MTSGRDLPSMTVGVLLVLRNPDCEGGEHAKTFSTTIVMLWRTHSCVPCRDSSRHIFADQTSTRVSMQHAGVRAPHVC
jgi:hypothetical protein